MDQDFANNFLYAGENKKHATQQMTLFGSLKGYTATCRTWGKNRLGHRQCKKYASTCGTSAEGCRDKPAPLPSEVGKRTQKDYEIEADALAQAIADEKNFELDFNKKLMRDVLSYGGIAPHKSGFMAEEYRQIPKKYKRTDGVPMDELAQEMGIDESTLADRIYQAEASFQELKNMRGGAIARKFKKSDFIDEGWDRLRSGRGFMGLGEIGYKIATKSKPFTKKYGISSETYTFPSHQITLDQFPEKKDLVVYNSKSGWIVSDNLNSLGKREAGWGWYGFDTKEEAVNNFISTLTPVKKAEKIIAEKAGQMTLFGKLPMPKMRIYSHG